MRLAIGLLMGGGFPIPPMFLLGWTDILQYILSGRGNREWPVPIDSIQVIHSQDFPVDTARNDIVRSMLDKDTADYLLFLDCDMRHPGHLAHRLLSHQLGIVTARYQMRKPPFHTVAMRRMGPGPHDYQSVPETAGLVRIDVGGAGALMLSRTVLESVRERCGDDWFRYQVGPNGLRTVSEDLWLYQQAAYQGYQAFCDLDCVCEHRAEFGVTPEWHTPFRAAYEAVSA